MTGLEREISKWGNSLAVRIPNEVFQRTKLKEGDAVDVEIVGEDEIRIRRKTGEDESE